MAQPNPIDDAPARVVPADLDPEGPSKWTDTWRRFMRHKGALAGGTVILVLVIIALLPDLLAPHDPVHLFQAKRGAPPQPGHPLGFDHLGRDMLSRLLHGTQVAFTVGLLATSIAAAIGITVGSIAGYFGGWVDMLISRLIDTVMAFPLLVLLIALAAILGPSMVTVVVIIGITVWAPYARVVRGDILSVRERDFITAARAAGGRDLRIIFRHVLPNVIGPIIVLATLQIGRIIILESALSFLGLGVQPPTPSWGGMLADGRAFIMHYPQIALAPGLMIALTVLSFNLMGDGLRDALDPRLKHQGARR